MINLFTNELNDIKCFIAKERVESFLRGQRQYTLDGLLINPWGMAWKYARLRKKLKNPVNSRTGQPLKKSTLNTYECDIRHHKEVFSDNKIIAKIYKKATRIRRHGNVIYIKDWLIMKINDELRQEALRNLR